MARIDAFLELAREQGCSDIHFSVGLPPLIRVDGELTPVQDRHLTSSETTELVDEILTDAQRSRIETTGSVDLAYRLPEHGRFRINVCRHLRGLSLICRVIPRDIPALADLGLPPIVNRFTNFRSGLVLVTGSTGTGKSTTLAAMIRDINERKNLAILSLEDPIEFLHPSINSLIVQREIGTDVPSFSEGLRSALREDPDVIMVGELRDTETMALALEASETGHLVLGTLHTRGAAQTIDRIVDAFPAGIQNQVRHTLADNLRGVLSQDLLRAADGRGRRAAMEVLVVTPAVSQMIRDGKTFQIGGAITTGRRAGMQLMDMALLALVRAGDIDPDEAFLKSIDKREFIGYVTDRNLLNLVGSAVAPPSASGRAA